VIGDWAQSPIPNPQSPIPNPQSPNKFYLNSYKIYTEFIILFKIKIKYKKFLKITKIQK